jgi:WhiB family transcriptional regulator, redox-sensing transcriptional regulator
MSGDETAVHALLREAATLTGGLPCTQNPQLWFSERPDDLELAKAGCRLCPLRGPCLAGAVERAEPCGVWGGEIIQRGRVLAVKRPPGRPPKRPGKGRRH